MNTPLENVFSDIQFISHAVKKFNDADYRLYKNRIDRLGLDPGEHGRAMQKLAEVMGL